MTILLRIVFPLLLPIILFNSVPTQAQLFGLGLGGEATMQRNLDAMSWKYKNKWNMKGERWFLNANSDFTSRLYLLNNKVRNIQDEFNGRMVVGYEAGKEVNYFSESKVYSYTNSGVNQFIVTGGVEWKGIDGLILKPNVGYYTDERSNRRDDGYIIGFEGILPQKRINSGWVLDAETDLEYADISPRTMQTYRFKGNARLEEAFFNILFNNTVSRSQRDSYQPSSFLNRSARDVLESVYTDTISTSVNLGTIVTDALNLNLSIGYELTSRTFDSRNIGNQTQAIFDSQFNQQNLYSDIYAEWLSDELRAGVGFRYSLSDNNARLKNIENLTDEQINRREEQLTNLLYDQSMAEIYNRFNWSVSSDYRVGLNSSISILRYDTPEINFDDRDELTFVASLNQKYKFNSALDLSLGISGEALHRVFLFSQRSIENNWRRSIRFEPSADWQPVSSVRLNYNFLVRSNYTTFDNKLTDGTTNDQSSREWGFNTKGRWDLNKHFTLEAGWSLNFLLIGQLFWEQFAETPIDTLITSKYEITLAYRENTQLVKVGLRTYTQEDFLPASSLLLRNENEDVISKLTTGRHYVIQIGPVVTADIPLDARNSIYIDGWLNWQFIKKRYYTSVAEEFIDAKNNIEKMRYNRTYPNLTMRVSYYF